MGRSQTLCRVIPLAAVPRAADYHHRISGGDVGHCFEELRDTIFWNQPCDHQDVSAVGKTVRYGKRRWHVAAVGNKYPSHSKSSAPVGLDRPRIEDESIGPSCCALRSSPE